MVQIKIGRCPGLSQKTDKNRESWSKKKSGIIGYFQGSYCDVGGGSIHEVYTNVSTVKKSQIKKLIRGSTHIWMSSPDVSICRRILFKYMLV
jgi:hypothetical protein